MSLSLSHFLNNYFSYILFWFFFRESKWERNRQIDIIRPFPTLTPTRDLTATRICALKWNRTVSWCTRGSNQLSHTIQGCWVSVCRGKEKRVVRGRSWGSWESVYHYVWKQGDFSSKETEEAWQLNAMTDLCLGPRMTCTHIHRYKEDKIAIKDISETIWEKFNMDCVLDKTSMLKFLSVIIVLWE